LTDNSDDEIGSALEQPFSHLQWYLNKAKNTVYLAAESSKPISKEDFHQIVILIRKLAPQLNCKADKRGKRHVVVESDQKTICKYESTDDLYESLADFIDDNLSIYSDPDLPNFRAACFNLAEPKDDALQSIYVCCSSHALMEGSESARILRTRQTVYHAGRLSAGLGFLTKLSIAFAGLILAPFHLAASRFNWKGATEGKWVVVDLDRKSVKKLARQFGVRQRSILFSLPLFGLHLVKSLPNRTNKKTQLVSYATHPDTKTTLEDTALNLRMQVGRIPTAETYSAHLQEIDKVLSKEDTTEVYSQAFYNSILGIHRVLEPIFPFLYGQRFFTYVPYDFVLSLLPPHVTGGVFRKFFDRSVFCGAYTPGVNTCVFVPYRNGVSLNLYVDPQMLENIDAFCAFLSDLGINCRRVV